MQRITSILRPTLRLSICGILIAFMVFSPLTPRSLSVVSAGGIGSATLGMQIVQQGELAVSATANTATAASNAVISGFSLQDFTKEFILDGIAWAIAKGMVNALTQSLLNWINSGFQGSPAFVADLDQLLFNALDQTAGEYIRGLGGVGEFICSPFRLDVQAALSINYAQARSGMPSGPTAASCTLSGIGDNIEGFLGGFSDGGIEEWFKITSNHQNTPYGAYLEAEAKLNARLVNAAGQEIEIASWGDGFLSRKICEGIEGTNASGNCIISTPGKVISEALTFQLSTGPRALIEADEINEIIGALINQLVSKAITGANGLLGLTGGTGYTDYTLNPSGGTAPYLDEAVEEVVTTNVSQVLIQLQQQINIEQSFLQLIDDVIPAVEAEIASRLATTDSSASTPDTTVTSTTTLNELTIDELDTLLGSADTGDGRSVTLSQLYTVLEQATAFRPIVVSNIAQLNELRDRLRSTTGTEAERQEAALEFAQALATGQYTSVTLLESKRIDWGRVVN